MFPSNASSSSFMDMVVVEELTQVLEVWATPGEMLNKLKRDLHKILVLCKP